MRTFFLLILMLVACLQRVSADPSSFEEFKQLSPKAQDVLLSDLSNPAHFTIVRWRRRLAMGEAAWQAKEQERLADKNGFIDLESLIIHHQHLEEAFLAQQFKKKVADGISPAQQAIELAHLRNRMNVVTAEYNNFIPLLAASSSTIETSILNQEAHALTVKWDKKWPSGTDWVITSEQMAVVDQETKKIVDQLTRLPKLAPKELQKAIDDLPPEEP